MTDVTTTDGVVPAGWKLWATQLEEYLRAKGDYGYPSLTTALAQSPHLDVSVVEHSTRVQDDLPEVTHWTVEVGEVGSEDEAQEVASLVRAALTPEPEAVRGGQEPVAWRVRVKSDDPEEWSLLPAGAGADYSDRAGYEVQPLYTSPAQGQREGACLGFVNVYRHEDGTPVLGSTDLDDDPSEPAYAAEYCEFIGKAKVVLLTSHKEGDNG